MRAHTCDGRGRVGGGASLGAGRGVGPEWGFISGVSVPVSIIP